MSVGTPKRPVRTEHPPDAERFRDVFARPPSARELAAFQAAHEALVLGLPRRARRRVARILTRL